MFKIEAILRRGAGLLVALVVGLGMGPLGGTVNAAGQILCVQSPAQATSAPCANATSFSTVQAAVDAAASGDEIRIAIGSYQGSSGSVVSVPGALMSLTVTGGFTGGSGGVGWTTPVP